jgi:hypothetical protein
LQFQNLIVKDSITKTVQIKVAPKPSFTTDITCSRTPTVFTNTTVETIPNPVYTWNVSNGFTSNSKNITRNWPNVGAYIVSLKADFTNGCSEIITKQIDVLSQPKAQFDVSDICSGETARFANKTIGESAGIKFLWDLGNGTDNVAAPVRVYNTTTSATFSIKLVAYYDGGCRDSIIKSLNVSESPTCDFNFVDNGNFNYTFTPSVPGYTKYEWFFGDGSYQVATNTSGVASYQYIMNDLYYVKMIATNEAGCNCEITKTIKPSTDIKTISSHQGITIYPNPNNGVFNIKNIGNKPMSISIFNALGVQVYQQNTDNDMATIQLDNASSGVYLVKITIDGYENIYKITVAQ